MMTLRCKPGDLAVVVAADGTGTAGELARMLIGRIVRVVRLRPPSVGPMRCTADMVWELEEPVRLRLNGRTYQADGIADEALRPIRDPGDDAQDEMLRPLPHEVPA